MLSINVNKERLSFDLDKLLKPEVLSYQYYFDKQHRLVGCSQFEKNIIHFVLGYCQENSLDKLKREIDSDYFQNHSKFSMKDFSQNKINSHPGNQKETFIKIVESLNNSRLIILKYLCDCKEGLINISCKILKTRKEYNSTYTTEMALKMKDGLFRTREKFSKIDLILNKITNLKIYLAIKVIPENRTAVAELMNNFEAQYGGFNTVNKVNFDTSKKFYNTIKELNL